MRIEVSTCAVLTKNTIFVLDSLFTAIFNIYLKNYENNCNNWKLYISKCEFKYQTITSQY